MTDARQKLQELLRELFQFDCADLDFGIYRIMNHKRAEIERFVEKDLLDAVARELDQGALSSQAQAASQLAEAAQEVRGNLGADAISPEGDLSEQYRTTPLGQRYVELRGQAATYRARPGQETLVFNHLYAFFSRYYQDGDFISKRRYSRRERYAIPYNGEEVYLHWANKDQYYVKTGEHFTDYTFKAPGGVTVHFKLQAADVEQNNVKGEKRFFIPLTAKATWEESSREVVIPFEYRPLTEQESIPYGTRDQQEKIIAEALERIPAKFRKQVEVAGALTAERRKNAKGDSVSYLEHHLRQYTRRNTSDFFIHKDLRGFLERELDFYLKNEVLNLEELLAGDDQRA
ncbi:TPA: site-specific DNA-methyltransferase, partial [Candidatus Acetothermia bacterium]|nr:site-specific DNA-methyltransferase [Candidatus Acetothermia bacterium]